MLKCPTSHCRDCGYCAVERGRWGIEHWCALDGYQLDPAVPPPWEWSNQCCLPCRRKGPKAPQYEGEAEDWVPHYSAARTPRPPPGFRSWVALFTRKPRAKFLDKDDTHDTTPDD